MLCGHTAVNIDATMKEAEVTSHMTLELHASQAH
jgi:hypothetical protein